MLDHARLAAEADRLSPLPGSALRLAEALNREDWDLGEITEIVSKDVALTAQVLRLANSPWGGAHEAVTSVETAVIRLGPAAILAVGVASAVKAVISDVPNPFCEEAWQDAVTAATFIEAFRDRSRAPLPEEALAVALMHNVGKVIIGSLVTEAELGLLSASRGYGLGVMESESVILGVTYPEASAMVLRHWKLPAVMAAVVQHHMTPASVPTEHADGVRVAHLVHLAVVAATTPEDADLGEAAPRALESLDFCRLTPADFAEVRADALERLEDTLAVLG